MWEEGVRLVTQRTPGFNNFAVDFLRSILHVTDQAFIAAATPTVAKLLEKQMNKLWHSVVGNFRAGLSVCESVVCALFALHLVSNQIVQMQSQLH
jgi:hypothetical protein